MAKETASNPTVRILVIGTAGAGKNCLESRFTTSQYPPPYDPSLTLCSRRFLTLEPKPSSDGGSRASRLPGLRVSTDFHGSTRSLLSPPDSAGPASPISDPVSPISFVSTTSTINTSTTSIPTSASFGHELELPKPQPCAKCVHRASTYLVEVVNYPALQSAKVRQHVLAKGEYDAVLLVYDVSDRRSFEKVREFHAEVPLISSTSTKHHRRQRSHVPRRHSGPPTGSSLQRRGSVMSFFSPGGGLAGPEEDVEAGKGSGDNVVVALVGNKADIGDGDSNLSEEDGLVDQDDDFDDDCESAIAVFGDTLHRDLREDAKLGAAWSVLGTTNRSKPSHAESSETVERWLQVLGKASEEDEEDGDHEPSASETAVTKAKPGRSVSQAEGEDLARSLDLQVPFFETSARMGTNVEEAFEAVRHASTTELAKRCRDKHEAEQQKRANRSSRPVDRMAPSAGPSRGQGNHGRLVLETKLDGQEHTAHLERPALVANVPGRENIPRRESFMDRMRRILTSEEARGGDGARGSANGPPDFPREVGHCL
ncbi:hypothetical protein INS49_003735 [Diaporthe citri]|uniref:uncharacterized protein n=1 Tax=Diaporthe citri TaxID=83186 RepID=UPI001C813E51|nr:uncharacterized protein INS49_003735 [Diaporthe citri]KAG6355769.1 hypothetical protein INS49_003735 [Diaporthe citri]